jgi:NADPH:quinone reductase-like Zn-dependent oxidoreductase
MKAIVYDRYGPPDVLRLEDLPTPVPRAGDVLVRVKAVPATRADCQMRQAEPFIARLALGLTRPRRPTIPGAELAGEVCAVGGSVTRFKVGDLVWGSLGDGLGAAAEVARVPEGGALTPMPSNVGPEEAAAICEGALTALTFLRDTAHLGDGQRLLVNGASGAVGSSAVQLGRHLGAHVTGVCSTANVPLVRSLGADEVIDYTRDDFTRSGERWDVIFDTVGRSSFPRARQVLTPRGRYVCPVLGTGIIGWALWTRWAGSQRAAIAFAGLRPAEEKTRDLELIRELVEAGRLKPVIDRRYPLERAAEAYRYVETGHKRGNVVLTVGDAAAA